MRYVEDAGSRKATLVKVSQGEWFPLPEGFVSPLIIQNLMNTPFVPEPQWLINCNEWGCFVHWPALPRIAAAAGAMSPFRRMGARCRNSLVGPFGAVFARSRTSRPVYAVVDADVLPPFLVAFQAVSVRFPMNFWSFSGRPPFVFWLFSTNTLKHIQVSVPKAPKCGNVYQLRRRTRARKLKLT